MRHPANNPHAPRLAVAGAVAGLLCLLWTAPVAADSKSGVIGHYQVKDTSAHPPVTCNYTNAYPSHYLVSLSVKAPKVWWPNTSKSDKNENGMVGWWPVIQRQTKTGWHTVTTGAEQQAVAHEDHPRYDAADRAPLTKKTIAWKASEPDMYRVVVYVTWYGQDAAMGHVKHVVAHYRMAYAGYSSKGTGGCSGRITILT
jgi:hypothetical protein